MGVVDSYEDDLIQADRNFGESAQPLHSVTAMLARRDFRRDSRRFDKTWL